MSPNQFYHEKRGSEFRRYSNAEIISFCRQVIALAESDEREETARALLEYRAMLKQRESNKPSEPWDDAPGVMVYTDYQIDFGK